MAPQTSRLYYVDALRSFCMLYGVFLHTCTLGNFGLLELIPVTSDYFRMSTFFLVSAFLAGMMVERLGAGTFAKKRTVALLVPFAVALLVLNPPTLWLIYQYFDNPETTFLGVLQTVLRDPDSIAGPAVWHLHLWFLISLYVYVLLAGPLLSLWRLRPVAFVVGRLAALPAWSVPTVLALATAGAVIVLRVAQEAIAPWTSEMFVVRATVLYLPFYALGLALYVYPALWDRVHRVDPVLIVLAAGLLMFQSADILSPASLPGKAFDMFTRAVVTGAAIFALLWLFRRIAAQDYTVTRLLGASIYTIYLVHFLVIYMLATLLKPTGLSGPALFWVVSLSTIAIGLAFHFWVVQRFAALTFLLNGRWPSRRVVLT